MQIIKDLASYIDEEIGDAQKYVKKALCVKDDMPQLAQVFYQLSVEEMDHMNRLHTEVVRIINKYRDEGKVIPGGMEMAYKLLHERSIDWAKEVKIMQGMFREM